MSESREHQRLVINIYNCVRDKFPNYCIYTDIQNHIGDNTPNLINNHRPDLYANSINKNHHIIGEAKTSFDLNLKRSEEQIMAFLYYLESRKNSDFMLSVPYCSGNAAKTILYFLSMRLQKNTTNFLICDECDWWQLKGKSWHLI